MSRRTREATWSNFVRLVVGVFGAVFVLVGAWIHVTEPSRTSDAALTFLFGVVLVFAAIFLNSKWLEGFGP